MLTATDISEALARAAAEGQALAIVSLVMSGGEVPSGDLDEVVDATIEHGRRIHNMEASRDQVLAALGAGQPDEAADLSA